MHLLLKCVTRTGEVSPVPGEVTPRAGMYIPPRVKDEFSSQSVFRTVVGAVQDGMRLASPLWEETV